MIRKPRITIIGDNGMEEVDYDSIPDRDPVELRHFFAPVRISSRALDLASQIIPAEYYKKEGLHEFLSERANKIFSTMPGHARVGSWGKLKYVFDFDKKGPLLKTVSL